MIFLLLFLPFDELDHEKSIYELGKYRQTVAQYRDEVKTLEAKISKLSKLKPCDERLGLIEIHMDLIYWSVDDSIDGLERAERLFKAGQYAKVRTAVAARDDSLGKTNASILLIEDLLRRKNR